LILSIPAFSAKVYVSSDQHGAKKVYVTSHREKAQILVYFVKDQNLANKPFFWFKVNDRNSADMIIHYFTDKNQADLIIYIVKDKNLACSLLK
jgi:hypothetical protein